MLSTVTSADSKITDLIQLLFITMSTTAEMKTYVGHCHCGAYKFNLTCPLLKSYTTCNCSICARKGYMYIDIPEGSTFNIERGGDKLKRYTFGNAKW